MKPQRSSLLMALAVAAGGPAMAGPESWAPVAGVVPAGGFVIDMTRRLDSLSFYNTAFLASEGAAQRIAWSGVLASCSPGTTSASFREDVRRRVNYYRAICGLPAAITFDAEPAPNAGLPGTPRISTGTSKRACAQAAAHMNAFSNVFTGDFTLSHSPASTTPCWSPPAWNGAAHSNLALGFFGPKAVDVYMADDDLSGGGSNNAAVGHRRWILYSRAGDMSSGDVPPGTYSYDGTSYPVLPANALYIAGADKPPDTAPKQFVTWPPAGYVPAPLIPLRWSLSFPGAGFSLSAITLTGPSGNGIPVSLLSHDNTQLGDNTMVFQPQALPVPGPADVTYRVTVTGLTGPGVPASHTWETTFFDPSVLGIPQTITGPARPPASGADYQFTAIPGATAYEVQAGTATAAAHYLENAEAAAPEITPDKTGTYPLLQGAASLYHPGPPPFTTSFAPRSGAKSFHLCFPKDGTEIDYLPHPQSFSLNPEFIPTATSTLTFNELFRWLFTVNRFSVELSADGGSHWSEIYGRSGGDTYNPNPSPDFRYDARYWDTAWKARSLSLAAWAGRSIRLRFILRPGAVSFDTADIDHGCFIDDIQLTNVQRLQTAPAITKTGNSFRFDSQLTGSPPLPGTTYLLRVRPEVGTRLMGYSAFLAVVPKPPTGFEKAHPSLAAHPQGDADGDGIANLIEYAFALSPLSPTAGSILPQPVLTPSGLSLSFAIPPGLTDLNYTAETSANGETWEPLLNQDLGSRRSFLLPVASGKRGFLRLRVTQIPSP